MSLSFNCMQLNFFAVKLSAIWTILGLLEGQGYSSLSFGLIPMILTTEHSKQSIFQSLSIWLIFDD